MLRSKPGDVERLPESVLSARLYLPKGANPQSKLPLFIYFHGGGFCIESAFCATYHNFLNLLVEKANVVAISVNYRRAPEFSLPIAFQDSWTSLKWVFSNPKEEWLNNYADFNRVFMGGDSAGATITHNVAVQAAHSELNGKFNGILVVHPYFLGVKPLDSEGDMDLLGKLWTAVYPTTSGLDDPLINPVKDPNFKKLACKKVLVCVAEKDLLVYRGKFYYEQLGKCGWNGVVELAEAKGENHVFFLSNPTCENAVEFFKLVVAFINASE
ncbi:hypothetical protein IFM89_009770 [Coptis chinensis]|uniref:Alpha/beta hydrolase fold-3 domain-containing protein n=1 Tax=Coptis chinensis TaxID=261450 RepID=A0A835I0R7_9MAGN|nr:hypothetical protein IFM89_009770 [Coptis chinensis]